jgi:hypothetical protein
MKASIYEARDVHRIPWPETDDGRFARAYLEPILRDGTESVAPNVKAELGVAIVSEHVVPFSVSVNASDQSYVVSPRTHYITYGQEEIGKLRSPTLERVLRAVVSRLGAQFDKAGFDRVVYVNNWLLSTNIYPRWSRDHALAVRDALVDRYPDRAVVFRSVDRRVGRDLERWLLEAGAHPVFSRRVLFQEPTSERVQLRRDYRRDAELLRKTIAKGAYRLVRTHELTDEQLDRVTELYDLLYVRKWSQHNPQLTRSYVRRVLQEDIFPGQALVTPAGRVDAAYGAWSRAGLFYVPILGYDIHAPQRIGLYRMISAMSSQEAADRNTLVHDSAGVSDFKQHRGAEPVLEHQMVFDAHLPPSRRPWRVLGALMRHLGVPLIERFNL